MNNTIEFAKTLEEKIRTIVAEKQQWYAGEVVFVLEKEIGGVKHGIFLKELHNDLYLHVTGNVFQNFCALVGTLTCTAKEHKWYASWCVLSDIADLTQKFVFDNESQLHRLGF